ncbi:hypothetical protein, partial [Haemophilus parainfluenzae]|uniref:hypothetical protein n=1 Tax=Haemophilus parainfluenzae TaxID=729 RepID=UPI001CED2658
LEQSTLPPIEQLAQPRVRIAGLQINPNTRGPALDDCYRRITLQDLVTGVQHPIDLPADAQIRHLHWSPEGDQLAFTLTTADG